MPAVNNMSVFTTKIQNNQDLAKNYLFLVNFKFDNKTLEDLLDAEEMLLRAKTATLPSKSISELSTEFMGSKLVYPGKATVDGDLSITFDEFQDMKISRILHKWSNLVFNHAIGQDFDAQGITGGAYSNYLKDYTATVIVDLYDSTLTQKLPISYKFRFCWPKEIAAAELNMEGSDKIQRSVTFKYSTYEVISNVG
jgi:hypothetical protein